MEPIIEVRDLSKKFILNEQVRRETYTSLREVVTERAKKLFRARTLESSDQEFYALRNLSFDVYQGDRLGIIGRNGAGKSTLLKLLSRITEPSAGSIHMRGRVASLLEVGTGFHPELTGRENIFLNGAILGMSRSEVRLKFDEIVSFAEVERFLDTPVKRYSSGMYVRLAFAVAAHLEPDILVVDEVLAVGDAQFQKKCLGKMEDVSTKEGRTVLFVSHNMAAVQAFTKKGLLLIQGKMNYFGDTEQAISKYTSSFDLNNRVRSFDYSKRGSHSYILSVKLIDSENHELEHYDIGKPLTISVEFVTDGFDGMSLELFFIDSIKQTKIGLMSLFQFKNKTLPTEPGRFRVVFRFPPIPLASGSYRVDAATSLINVHWDHLVESALLFDVVFSSPTGTSWDFKASFDYGNYALVSEDVTFELVS